MSKEGWDDISREGDGIAINVSRLQKILEEERISIPDGLSCEQIFCVYLW